MVKEKDRRHKWEKKKVNPTQSGSENIPMRRKRIMRHITYTERLAKMEIVRLGLSTTRPNRMVAKRTKHLDFRG